MDQFTHVKSLDGERPKKAASRGCCGFLAGKKPPAFRQTLVLLRHSIRKDREDPSWRGSQDGKDWPSDTPITPAGYNMAKSVAKELQELHNEANFTAVACSPYRRCIETASEVAKLLNLPMVLDQEMGEIWDDDIHQEPQPWRSNAELRPMCKELGINVLNPIIDGGFKLFGKKPKFPETLDSAKTRYIVRIETYLEQSSETQQNFIIVTHADALAAALVLFERGNANVQSMEYCARIIAKRSDTKAVKIADSVDGAGVFAKMWDVKFKGLDVERFAAEKHMEKYYEKEHLEIVAAVDQHVAVRRKNRTKTDAMFMKTVHKMAKDPEDNEEDEEQDAAPAANRT
mmetsp:Transcript_42579/g.109964  ORF Transcript_42579/g.109964 Transcript_42579/m.109964 type:complete len:344 (+) Transcript_42579:57-1088(+)